MNKGARKIRDKYLPYARQWIDDDDIQAVVDVLKSDWITTGPRVREFEEKFAEYVGTDHAIAVSSGTAALHAAVYAAGIEADDEVITTPYTFVATANCVLYQGGTPVFADIREDTLNIDPTEIKKKINDKTRAIIPVDFAGQPCDYDQIIEIAKERDLVVIEDAAHALGGEYRKKKIGSIADMTVFSFHPVKHITTGEGGMITTDSEKYAERLRRFRNHGITTEAKQREEQGSWFYEMVDLGYNYRMTDFQCALGIRQLEKIDMFIERRGSIADRYNTELSDVAEIEIPVVGSDIKHAWHLYIILLNLVESVANKEKIFRRLREANIGVNVHYIPIHLHPFYKKKYGFLLGDYPISESAYNRALTLPLYPMMTSKDQDDVVGDLKNILGEYQ